MRHGVATSTKRHKSARPAQESQRRLSSHIWLHQQRIQPREPLTHTAIYSQCAKVGHKKRLRHLTAARERYTQREGIASRFACVEFTGLPFVHTANGQMESQNISTAYARKSEVTRSRRKNIKLMEHSQRRGSSVIQVHNEISNRTVVSRGAVWWSGRHAAMARQWRCWFLHDRHSRSLHAQGLSSAQYNIYRRAASAVAHSNKRRPSASSRETQRFERIKNCYDTTTKIPSASVKSDFVYANSKAGERIPELTPGRQPPPSARPTRDRRPSSSSTAAAQHQHQEVNCRRSFSLFLLANSEAKTEKLPQQDVSKDCSTVIQTWHCSPKIHRLPGPSSSSCFQEQPEHACTSSS
ncbi:unnamed protein product, partial [Trichogramma brassicae]